MPELPEVEVVRRGLAERLIGSTWLAVDVWDKRMLMTQSRLAEDPARLSWFEGAAVRNVVRRGKYLWLVMERGDASNGGVVGEVAACIVHLGMSGQLHYGEGFNVQPRPSHARAQWRFRTSDGRSQTLTFVDQRMFGWFIWDSLVIPPDGRSAGHGCAEYPGLPTWACDADMAWLSQWYPEPAEHLDTVSQGTLTRDGLLPRRVAHIGRDALDPWADLHAVVEHQHRRQVTVKAALLDQRWLSGIGNIYAAEALWLARIDPRRLASRTSATRLRRAYQAAAWVIVASLYSGGTTFDNQYTNVNGQAGSFLTALMVYGRAGLPCRRCGETLRSIRQAGRVTVYCPACQR